jgi:hypothetical protein
MKTVQPKIFVLFVICLLCVTGCVAPPKPGSNASTSYPGSSQSGTDQVVENPTSAPLYVTIEAPYTTIAVESVQRTTVPVATPTPDEYLQIYSTTEYFIWNATSFSFNLTKPPMIINFAVFPENVTGKKTVSSKFESKEDIEVTYDRFSPNSWFEITVRNKNYGRVILQDGFGTYKQYSDDTGRDKPRTMKVIQPGIVKIDMAGNQITATVNVSVPKTGNIEQ